MTVAVGCILAVLYCLLALDIMANSHACAKASFVIACVNFVVLVLPWTIR